MMISKCGRKAAASFPCPLVGVPGPSNLIFFNTIFCSSSNLVFVRRFYSSKSKKSLRKHRRVDKMSREIVESLEKGWNGGLHAPDSKSSNFGLHKKRVPKLLIDKIREDLKEPSMQAEYRRGQSARNNIIEHYRKLSSRLGELKSMRDLKEKILREEKSGLYYDTRKDECGSKIENLLEERAIQSMNLDLEDPENVQIFLPKDDLLSSEFSRKIKSCVHKKIQLNQDTESRMKEMNQGAVPISVSKGISSSPRLISPSPTAMTDDKKLDGTADVGRIIDDFDEDAVIFETVDDATMAGIEIPENLLDKVDKINVEVGSELDDFTLSPLTYSLRKMRQSRQLENEIYNEILENEFVCPMPLAIRDIVKIYLKKNLKIPIRLVDPFKPRGITLKEFFDLQGFLQHVDPKYHDRIEELISFSEKDEVRGDLVFEKLLSSKDGLLPYSNDSEDIFDNGERIKYVSDVDHESNIAIEESDLDSGKTQHSPLDGLKSEQIYDFRKLIRDRNWLGMIEHCTSLQDSILNGENPLHICVILDEVEGLNHALQQKIFNVNQSNNNGMTPLHMASLRNGIKSSEILIAHGANINARDDEGFTSLHYAVAMDFTILAQYLLKKGAYIDLTDYQGANIVHIASEKGNLDLIKIALQNGLSIDKTTDNGESALFLACEANNTSTVRYLLQNNASWEIPNEKGLYPIHAAVKSNSVGSLRILLDNGADPNAKDCAENTPLHYGALLGNVDICRHLVASCAYLDSQNLEGWTPLHLAAQSGYESVAAFLRQMGAKINMRNEEGSTPLLIALSAGRLEVAQKLVEWGADINIGNASNITPLYLAIQEGYLDFAVELINLGANIHCRTIEMITLLHVALESQHLELAHLLLDRGIDPLAPTADGYEPIHFAVTTKEIHLVERLLIMGANPNACSNDGVMPLSIAENNHENAMIELLERYGAKKSNIFDMV